MKLIYLKLKKHLEPTSEIKIYTGYEQAQLRDLTNQRRHHLAQIEAINDRIEDIIYEAKTITITESGSNGDVKDGFTD